MRAKHQDVRQLELWPDKGKHRETVVDKVASYKQKQTPFSLPLVCNEGAVVNRFQQ